VLRPGGQLVIMVYAAHSLNYYVSILFLRRILCVLLYCFDKLTFGKMIHERILRGHIANVNKVGLRTYLKRDVFLSHNTDTPANPYSRVYTKEEVVSVFAQFHFTQFKQFFLNERHLPMLKICPKALKRFFEYNFGWHLWCWGEKKRI